MATPKPKPPVGKTVSKDPAQKPPVKRNPHLTHKAFRDSEPLRKLQSDLHKNSKRKDA